MLNENIKNLRKSKGLSQEELAFRLNVVRQTVSKWENGLSVPDADMLICMSEVFETPVSVLLGETTAAADADELKVLCGKLETINLQLADMIASKRRMYLSIFTAIFLLTAVILIILCSLQSPYLGWDYTNAETAVAGVIYHAFEWLFIRTAPFVLVFSAAGIAVNMKK